MGKAWQTMEELQKEGKTKSIGVSNYRIQDLEETLKVAKVRLHTGIAYFKLCLADLPFVMHPGGPVCQPS